ncbi:hypothetical protein NDU88_001487 [Pleurodeles waltl]|uniref:Secreted protein n=1 Tax=Pleurodeles waltl TaxID=8319 RepID=A0AAV7U6I3_PLEWA|nr:hypothetical protein NDU88_001487 [Pleurodeles waltl]
MCLLPSRTLHWRRVRAEPRPIAVLFLIYDGCDVSGARAVSTQTVLISLHVRRRPQYKWCSCRAWTQQARQFSRREHTPPRTAAANPVVLVAYRNKNLLQEKAERKGAPATNITSSTRY